MEFKTITYEATEGIATLCLNRPDALNVLNEDMRDELREAISKAAEDREVHALILSAKGRTFCAGADLEIFKKDFERFESTGIPSGFYDIGLPAGFASFPKPLIGAINGPAVGVGMTMSLACDIVLASREASFSAPFARIGLTPEFGSSYYLPRRVGYTKAAEWLFTGKMITAQEALEQGLVNQVVAAQKLMDEANAIAQSIVSMPQEAIVATKGLLRFGEDSNLSDTLEKEGEVFQRLQRTQSHYDAVCSILRSLHTKD